MEDHHNFLKGFFDTLDGDERPICIEIAMLRRAKTSEDFKFLIDMGIDIHMLFNDPSFVLESEERLQALLENGFDINHVDTLYRDCICKQHEYSAGDCRGDRCGCTCSDSNRDFLLFCNLTPTQMKLALDNGADLHKDVERRKAIHVYSEMGTVEHLQLLCEYGADINSVKSNGKKQPIHIASSWGNIGIIKFLIDNGADIYATDLYNHDAISHAMDNNVRRYIESLI